MGAILHQGPEPIVRTYQVVSKALNRTVEIDVYRPAVFPTKPLNLVVFNDGQDLRKMRTKETLGELHSNNKLSPTLVVGLVAADRMREYGTSERLDYKGRGDLSRAHEIFVTEELTPWLESRFMIYKDTSRRAIAGFSLGGLNAFDLAWRNPNHFSTAGVFSGALWWRSNPFLQHDPDADRIIHTYVEAAPAPPSGFRAWLMAGTDDETDDRNNNGVIDAIDDSTDLHRLLITKGLANPHEVCYFEVQGGQHNPDTWADVMGDFLEWLRF